MKELRFPPVAVRDNIEKGFDELLSKLAQSSMSDSQRMALYAHASSKLQSLRDQNVVSKPAVDEKSQAMTPKRKKAPRSAAVKHKKTKITKAPRYVPDRSISWESETETPPKAQRLREARKRRIKTPRRYSPL